MELWLAHASRVVEINEDRNTKWLEYIATKRLSNSSALGHILSLLCLRPPNLTPVIPCVSIGMTVWLVTLLTRGSTGSESMEWESIEQSYQQVPRRISGSISCWIIRCFSFIVMFSSLGSNVHDCRYPMDIPSISVTCGRTGLSSVDSVSSLKRSGVSTWSVKTQPRHLMSSYSKTLHIVYVYIYIQNWIRYNISIYYVSLYSIIYTCIYDYIYMYVSVLIYISVVNVRTCIQIYDTYDTSRNICVQYIYIYILLISETLLGVNC